MKKENKSTYKSGKGVKTFIVYFLAVFLFIAAALGIKAYFLLKESKFDGHFINIGITQNKKLVEIMGFDADDKKISLLVIKNATQREDNLGNAFGILPDTRIDSPSDLSKEDVSSVLKQALFGMQSIKTDLTIFDLSRLLFLTKNVSGADINRGEISMPISDSDMDNNISNLFINNLVRSESVSVQIVNATDSTGLGKRLARVLSNLGFNIISISTERSNEQSSKILYSGKTSYSLEKLKSLLGLKTIPQSMQSIADVVIIIGDNLKSTKAF